MAVHKRRRFLKEIYTFFLRHWCGLLMITLGGRLWLAMVEMIISTRHFGWYKFNTFSGIPQEPQYLGPKWSDCRSCATSNVEQDLSNGVSTSKIEPSWAKLLNVCYEENLDTFRNLLFLHRNEEKVTKRACERIVPVCNLQSASSALTSLVADYARLKGGNYSLNETYLQFEPICLISSVVLIFSIQSLASLSLKWSIQTRNKIND